MSPEPSKPCIVITGASGGIGSSLVELLEQNPEFESYTLVGIDLHPQEIKKSSQASRFICYTADVSSAPQIESLFSALAREYSLMGLVNAAGMLHYGPALDCGEETLHKLLAVNAAGVFNVSNAAARHMVEQNKAAQSFKQRSIVTIASNAGTGPRSYFSAYGASKAFASHYTRSLGLEVAPFGIRANVVCPGTTRTSMLDPIWQGQDKTAETIAGTPEHFRNGIPLKKIAQPSEIASTVIFLLSEASSHVTLAELTVDGGATQR